MPQFKRVALVIEAVRITEHIQIDGQQGTIRGEPGDWLITGIEGEQYVLPHSRFTKLYEPADERARAYLEKARWGETVGG